jgi:hypothetical protein
MLCRGQEKDVVVDVQSAGIYWVYNTIYHHFYIVSGSVLSESNSGCDGCGKPPQH